MIQMNLFANRMRLTGLENKLMSHRGRNGGADKVREFGMDMLTLLYLKWINNQDLPYSTRNSAHHRGVRPDVKRA